ncbi:MAG TPA: LysM peptidoglycan-binding domain-containing protein [Clostridiaceae bacterium]|nr:LysM peptidoglycan-binding domain-containing protein [Clostridiaceae bacterium]
MAKASAPISTRLVATINARYYPVEGIADAYCLDGKFPSKRELRSVNTTLDRDSKGSFVALFGYSSDGRSQASAWQEPLKRLAEQVNSDSGDIDNDINDLAETAMDVTGRIRLADDASREPYFSGVIIRDGEMAAVTVGDSLAFVYRHEALYPLTSSTKKLEPTDLYGDRVEGFEDFIAGEAGTIRYSNIAQIEQGDRLILCNSEVFDTVGQAQMMRHLEEAEDSLDAAGLLLTAAASQMPGTPMQVAVADVISVREDEPAAARFSLGRFATQAMEPVVIEPVEESPDMDFARTQRYQKQDMVDMMKATPASEKPKSFGDEWARDYADESEEKSPFAYSKPADPISSDEESLFAPYRGFGESSESVPNLLFDDDDGYADYKQESEPSGHLPVFAYNSEAQRRRKAQYDDYRQHEAWDAGDELDDESVYDPYSDDEYDDLGYERRPRASDRTRRIAFYIILIAIIIVSIVALIKLLAGGGSDKPSDDTTTSTTQTEPVIVPEVTTTTVPPSETTTTAPDTSGDTIYTVQKGDSLWSISMKFYEKGLSQKGLDKLARYNGLSGPNEPLQVGQEIKLPPIETLRAMD